MSQTPDPIQADIFFDEQTSKLVCSGAWTIQHLTELGEELPLFIWPEVTELIIDGEKISHFDSVGALLLIKILKILADLNIKTTLENFSKQKLTLFKLIQHKEKQLQLPAAAPALSPLARLGKKTINAFHEGVALLAFLGELVVVGINSLRKPSALQLRTTFSTIEITGLQALPIIALLSFLIGVVLAYQMGLQLRNYGANIYIVDLLGLSILREFSPLITAILVAGRTSSAFTAELGMMKVNEELDALRTMGETPTALLALPKLIGLLISFPLLIVWSDIFGVLGGMIMAKTMLGINCYDFLMRFQQNIALRHYFIGLSKAPAFAIIVATVGCFLGFQVSGGADSVGRQTTKSVVLAIFLIIVADAGFSILFSWQNL